jgi:hypothetical protein
MTNVRGSIPSKNSCYSPLHHQHNDAGTYHVFYLVHTDGCFSKKGGRIVSSPLISVQFRVEVRNESARQSLEE